MTPQPTHRSTPVDLDTLYSVWAAVTQRPGSVYALGCGVTGLDLLHALNALSAAGYIAFSEKHMTAAAIVLCAIQRGRR